MSDLSIEENLCDDSELMHLTTAEAIERMQEAWINEVRAPEILPYKQEYVDCVLELIHSMEENLESVDSASLLKVLHQLEIDRLRYIITSYLRTRLKKIETYVFFILKEEDLRSEKGELYYLSSGELEFAREFRDSIEQHFHSVQSFWPGLPPSDWKDKSPVPNFNSFVFFKAKEKIEGILLDDNDESDVIDVVENSQVVLPYSKIANLLKADKVCLL